jgi:hypothetical protein
VLLACIRLARAAGVALTAYSDDRIFCDATNEQTDRLLFYKEPPPEGVGNMEKLVGRRCIQKARGPGAGQARRDAPQPARSHRSWVFACVILAESGKGPAGCPLVAYFPGI